MKLVCTGSNLDYSLSWKGRKLFNDSALSLFPNAEHKVLNAEIISIDKTWKTVWGQFSSVRDHCNQLTLKLKSSEIRTDLIVRVYDDGVGFRFVVPKQEGTAEKRVRFISEYNAAGPFAGWFPRHEDAPIGPVPFGERRESSLMPVLIDSGNGAFLGLLESDLYTAEGFEAATIAGNRSESTATLTPEGLITPWRVILLGNQPGALLMSPIPLNLAAECKLKDTSWIKPGKTMWDWRVHGYKAGEFQYGINTASYLRFNNFAASNNVQYFLMDDLWFKRASAGHLEPSPGVDVAEVMRVARERGVKVLLYYDRNKGDVGDEALFPLLFSLGAVGTKYGFISPEDFLKMAMINALTGPLDQANGAFGLNGINAGERQRGPKARDSYNSTVVSEAARVLVIFSGLISLPDAPEEYAKKADLFEFIRHMPPATWDDTKLLNSRIGKSITTARRSGDEWFVGSVINESGGELRIPLDFLTPGVNYDATYYEDAPDSHYINNREAYRIRKGVVTQSDVITATLAPGGGHCLWIRPRLSPPTLPSP